MSSSFVRLALESPSESATIPESDDVELNFGRFNGKLLCVSSMDIVFDSRGLLVDIACLGRTVCRSRRRMYLFDILRK